MNHRLLPLVLVTLLTTGLCRAADLLQGIEINGSVLVPLRSFTDWRQIQVTYTKQQLTLTRAGTAVVYNFGERVARVNGTAKEMPLACMRYIDTTYIPIGYFAHAFGVTPVYDAGLKRISLTSPDRQVTLAYQIQPATPSECATAETLAGLTIGEHPLKAYVLWGEPLKIERSTIPGAKALRFEIGPGNAEPESETVLLVVTIRDDRIVLVSASTSFVPDDALQPYLKQIKTKRGLQLGLLGMKWYTYPDKLYGEPYAEYGFFDEQGNPIEDESGDLTIGNYYAGDLTLITVYYAQGPILCSLELARRGTPRNWANKWWAFNGM